MGVRTILRTQEEITISKRMAPFLTERFREVHLFDLRYNRLSPLAYIWDNDIDVVLVLYSFDTYITGENQFLLAR